MNRAAVKDGRSRGRISCLHEPLLVQSPTQGGEEGATRFGLVSEVHWSLANQPVAGPRSRSSVVRVLD